MPHFRDFIDPNFLCNLDFLNDQGQYYKKIVTIKNVTKEEVHNGKGGTEIVATVHTNETKPFVLSKTNMKTIVSLTKKVNTDDWKGERIELFIAENIKAFGNLFDVIRVSKARPAQVKPVDYSTQIATLRACKTLDELKNTFIGLSKDEQTATFSVKEEMKAKLTPAQEATV